MPPSFQILAGVRAGYSFTTSNLNFSSWFSSDIWETPAPSSSSGASYIPMDNMFTYRNVMDVPIILSSIISRALPFQGSTAE
mmetsp:Transcript_38294/g.80230  ORF Transcript_38294/g.80230 Transcript_38294/m.80230 type:complete len:82 (+) Transcript_38294:186-431(+)